MPLSTCQSKQDMRLHGPLNDGKATRLHLSQARSGLLAHLALANQVDDAEQHYSSGQRHSQ